MQTVTLVSAFVLVAVALLTAPQTDASAPHCCPPRNGGCGDCTKPTPYCGYGPCNIIGCNCDGGCRAGNCFNPNTFSSDSENDSPESFVAAGDANGDGVLSIKEAVKLLQQRQGHSAAHLSAVRSLDKNNDGYLSVDEINS